MLEDLNYVDVVEFTHFDVVEVTSLKCVYTRVIDVYNLPNLDIKILPLFVYLLFW